MKPVSPFLICLASLLASLPITAMCRANEPSREGIEVDARGPLHEAYARPWQADPAPNQALDKKPPDPIPEEPAAEKPVGKNVQWIPGYWQWDQDRKDFIWVSGFWREMPQGRRWVMGYWVHTADGWRWVSGHFAAPQERDFQYVPLPPHNPDDRGAATQPPDDRSAYIPGSWFYGEDGYSYREGYWTEGYDDRMWVPACYYWTPYGYCFCSGYWDYPLGGRGLLFAPCFFTRPLWLTSGWCFRPWLGIGFGGLCDNLFVGLGCGHYFFGDYYAPFYFGLGFCPWFWHCAHFHDPHWAHCQWANRANPAWAANMRANFVGHANGTLAAPARTLAAQSHLVTGAKANTGSPQMLQTMSQLRASGQNLTAVTAEQRSVQMQAARQMVTQAQNLARVAPLTMSTGSRIGLASGSSGLSTSYYGSGVRSFSTPSSGTFRGGVSPGVMSGSFGPRTSGGFHSGGFGGGGGSHGGMSSGGHSGGGGHGGGGHR